MSHSSFFDAFTCETDDNFGDHDIQDTSSKDSAPSNCSTEEMDENDEWHSQIKIKLDNASSYFYSGTDPMEGPSNSAPPKLFKVHEDFSGNEGYESESSESSETRNSEGDEELRQFNSESSCTRREASTVEGINDLIRKFSTIELLRKKENLRLSQEATNNDSPSCSSKVTSQTPPKPWVSEEFMEEKFSKIPDPREDWKESDYIQEEEEEDDSDSDKDDTKVKDMELLKFLLSHALGKENQDRKKRGDEILTASCRNTKFFEDNSSSHVYDENMIGKSPRSEEAPSETLPFSFQTEEKETSLDLNEIFDGYEIDCPNSFHDWMVDSVLSKDLIGPSDLAEDSNYLL